MEACNSDVVMSICIVVTPFIITTTLDVGQGITVRTFDGTDTAVPPSTATVTVVSAAMPDMNLHTLNVKAAGG